MGYLGTFEELDYFDTPSQAEEGRISYRLEEVGERLYQALHRGHIGAENFHQYQEYDMRREDERTQNRYDAISEFGSGFAGAIQGINEDFIGAIGEIEIKDDYLQASHKELDAITRSVESAAKLLESPYKGKIRTMGDLTNKFQKIKRARQRAASDLEVASIGQGATVSYRDPLTGEMVTRNQYRSANPDDYMDAMNTDSFNAMRDFFKRRVQQDADWITNFETEQFTSAMENVFADVGLGGYNPNQSINLADYGYEGIIQSGPALYESLINRYQDLQSGDFSFAPWAKGQALRQFIGSDVNIAGTPEENLLYSELASMASITYGNLYRSAYDSMANILSSVNTGFGSALDAQVATEEQKFVAQEQQKALRQSIRKLGESFSRGKQRLLPKEKEPLARFTGFQGGRPQ